MTLPKNYNPEYGYKYQILTRYKNERMFEHCDYAKNRQELQYLVNEYKLAYGNDYQFKSILLPKKYHMGGKS